MCHSGKVIMCRTKKFLFCPFKIKIKKWNSILTILRDTCKFKRYRHYIIVPDNDGGWPKEVKACFLNSYMVYL
jgi:hypothetical protein